MSPSGSCHSSVIKSFKSPPWMLLSQPVCFFKTVLSLAGQWWTRIDLISDESLSIHMLLRYLQRRASPVMFLPKVKHQTKTVPESFCWRASSCPIRSVGTLTAALWSGSPFSWCTESPSASAGSAPRLTATCSAPFEKNENSAALIFPSGARLKRPPCSAAQWPATLQLPQEEINILTSGVIVS